MKKKSSTRSAFFNLRVLTGLTIILAGVSLALLGSGTFSVQAKPKGTMADVDLSVLPPGFDCSRIHDLGIDKKIFFASA